MKTRSVLPNSSAEILKPLDGKNGVFQVEWNERLDIHILFFTDSKTQHQHTIAGHHNGFSCHALAQALIQGNADASNRQFKYILDCGGIGCSITRLDWFVQI